MEELTIVTLCQTLSNLTHNRCTLVENFSTCRCISDLTQTKSSTVSIHTPPDIMLSEIFLIFFVLAIWLSAIGFCLNQYKSLRRLETQVHYCVSRKDPLNIGEIKIVTREQDSIIYKKKRYSTILDTQINPEDLKAMQYVQQYLPKNSVNKISSALSNLVLNHDDVSNNIPLATLNRINSLNTLDEQSEYQTSDIKISYIQRTESARYTPGLTVPHLTSSASSQSSWNDTSSTKRLCVPSNSLKSNCYSTGNVSLPVPQLTPKTTNEQLLDPRLIPATVRRSLLALHRESQENVNFIKKKDKTRSENDVHGALTPLKLKLKTKPKRQLRPHSNTLSILPLCTNSPEYDRHSVIIQRESFSRTPSPIIRRSLRSYPNYSTQSTSESETTQDIPLITNIYISTDDDESSKTIIETTANKV